MSQTESVIWAPRTSCSASTATRFQTCVTRQIFDKWLQTGRVLLPSSNLFAQYLSKTFCRFRELTILIFGLSTAIRDRYEGLDEFLHCHHVEMSSEDSNPYELLGIKLDANEQEIKTAYRQRSLKIHPDKVYARQSRLKCPWFSSMNTTEP
jgi:hypothetical protein